MDKTWIVSGQSEEQRQMIRGLPKDKAIYVEGGYRLGLALFACAASDFDAGRMGASYDITKLIPTCISPPPAFPC